MAAISELLFLVAAGPYGCGERAAGSSAESSAALQTGDGAAHGPPSFASADLPLIGGGEDTATQLWIELTVEGRGTVNGVTFASEADLLRVARAAVLRNPGLRAWIKAPPAVTYGELMAVIDVLKQVGISRMAFGFSPTAAP